jgi:hypothetical protein
MEPEGKTTRKTNVGGKKIFRLILDMMGWYGLD